MEFYKIINNGLEPAPGYVFEDNMVISNPDPDTYRRHGYMTLDITPPTPPTGYVVKTRTLRPLAGTIVADYTYAPRPPRNLELSKRKLMNNLKSIPGPDGATMWDMVRQWMESTDKWDDWLMSTTLMERDPMMVDAIAALPSVGLASEQIDTILQNSQAD